MDSAIEVVANLLGIHRETFKPAPMAAPRAGKGRQRSQAVGRLE
jgi:hypothetical protein